MTHPNLGDQPAFPCTTGSDGGAITLGVPLRSYAAIALRIPDSGDPILNVMIHDAQRRDIAAMALHGLLAGRRANYTVELGDAVYSESVRIADALLIELAKEKP